MEYFEVMAPRHIQHASAVALICCLGAASVASADLFQFDMELQSTDVEWLSSPVQFSALVSGTDDSDPDEPWESFSLADSGPWELVSPDPLVTLTGSELFMGYGPTFGWGGMSLEVVDLIGPDESVTLDWTLSGPEWNHDSIGGTGSGSIQVESDASYAVEITSWQITLVPAPAALCGLLGLPVVLRRRRS